MAIQGSLSEVSLADVLQLLSLGKKTGRLSLNDGGLQQGYIYLDAGRVCQAGVVKWRDDLGKRLIKTGKVTQSQFDDAAKRRSVEGEQALGEILVGSGSVSRKDLDRFVRGQVEEAVTFMFTWKRGSFLFQSRLRPESRDFLVSLDPEAMLLEAARRVDEWSLLRKRIPSFEMIFRVDAARLAKANVTLTDEQTRIVPWLDGTRSVMKVIDATGLTEFEVAKALYGLITAGYAKLVERRGVMRHLTYREFLAYVVSEAEFEEPASRRRARHHIERCSLCTQRLKRIHRRTAEVLAVESESGAAKRPSEPRDDVRVVSRGGTKPRAERRSGVERRKEDRRWKQRRLAERPGLSPSWPTEQRRRRDRRQGDRRTFVRRSADRPTSTAERGERRSPAAGSASPAPPKAAPAKTAAARSTSGSPPARTGSGPSATSRPRHRRTSDIEWLITPDDADDMLRRQSQSRPAVSRQAAASAPPVKRRPEPTKPPPPAPKPKAPAPVTPEAGKKREVAKGDRGVETDVHSATTKEHPIQTAGSATRGSKADIHSATTKEHPIQTAGSATRGSKADIHSATTEEHPIQTAKSATKGTAARTEPADRRTRETQGVSGTAEPQRSRATRAWTPPPERVGNVMVGGALARPSIRKRIAEAEPTQPRAVSRSAPPAVPKRQRRRTSWKMGRPSWLHVAAAFLLATGLGWYGGAYMGLRPGAGERGVANAGPSGPSVPSVVEPDSSEERPTVVATAADAGRRTEPAVPDPVVPSVEARPIARDTLPRISAAPPRVRERIPATPPVAAERPVETPPTVPSVTVLRGVVRDAASGAPLGGARVSVAGTGLATQADAAGVFEIRAVPRGPVTLEAALDGHVSATVEVIAGSTSSFEVELAPAGPPTALEPDTGLAGPWVATTRAEAAAILGQPPAVIPGVWIESVARLVGSSRPRIRIAQLTASGERVMLIMSESGAFVRSGPARVTALRIMPATEAYPITTGTASFGTLLVTAQTRLAGDSLRVLLTRLEELR